MYLLGSDNLDIRKNNEFIVYQGSHGDRGAEIADIVLPSAAFTEQNGLYENLEGRVQECKKASYPIGEALEDWKVFNLILNKLGKKENISSYELLKKEVLNFIPNFTNLNELPIFKEITKLIIHLLFFLVKRLILKNWTIITQTQFHEHQKQ